MILEGVYRRFIPLRGGKAGLDIRLTHLESFAAALVEPFNFERTRAGRTFHIGYAGSALAGIAPVQAIPSTVSQWAIFNADTAKSYIFTTLGSFLISGTKGLGGQLLAAIFQLPSQAGLALPAGLVIGSGSNSAIGSKVVVKSAVTITNPAAPVWIPVAEDILSGATVGPANCMINRNLNGSIVLPPGYGLGLAVLAPAGTTPLYLPVAEWMEAESDLE